MSLAPRRGLGGLGRLLMRAEPGLAASIAILAVVGGGYAWFVRFTFDRGGSEGVIGALVLAPFVAVILAVPLINLFATYIRWVRERVWDAWQGRYYTFDDRQIRIVEARGQLWFATADVHAALAMRLRPGVLARYVASERRPIAGIGDGLSHAGLVRLLARSTDPAALRFLLWAERDVARPWQNKRALLKLQSAGDAGPAIIRDPPP